METSHSVIQIAVHINICRANVCGAGGGIRSRHKGSEPTTLEGQGRVQTGCLVFPEVWEALQPVQLSLRAVTWRDADCSLGLAARLQWCTTIPLRQGSPAYSSVHLWPCFTAEVHQYILNILLKATRLTGWKITQLGQSEGNVWHPGSCQVWIQTRNWISKLISSSSPSVPHILPVLYLKLGHNRFPPYPFHLSTGRSSYSPTTRTRL